MSEIERELECATGKVLARVGDAFARPYLGEDWTIVRFGERPDIVFCKPEKMPGWAAKYQEADGTVQWCNDAVAANLLEKADGKPRDARGHFLTKATT